MASCVAWICSCNFKQAWSIAWEFVVSICPGTGGCALLSAPTDFHEAVHSTKAKSRKARMHGAGRCSVERDFDHTPALVLGIREA